VYIWLVVAKKFKKGGVNFIFPNVYIEWAVILTSASTNHTVIMNQYSNSGVA